MRLPDLERMLRDEHGFTFCRQSGSHRVYRDAAGHALTITAHHGGRWGHTYCRAELVAIRRTLDRLRRQQLQQLRKREEV